jgi:6-phosphofructokinase
MFGQIGFSPVATNDKILLSAKMKPRIGVLTSGGDCPGLNAVLRGVVLAAEKLGWDVVGFRDGFEGLLPPGNHVVLDRKSIDGIMALGGTIIGTTNRGHFVAKTGAGDRTVAPARVIADAKKYWPSFK